MQRTRRPHPRSLDALFGPAPTARGKLKPKQPPRKARVKLCLRGHKLPRTANENTWCRLCFEERQEAERASNAAADREEWRRLNGPSPAVMEIRFKATGRVARYTIPPHLRPRKVRGRRSRRAV